MRLVPPPPNFRTESFRLAAGPHPLRDDRSANRYTLMDDPPLNPAQHVERIREILVGRQLTQLEERLRILEEAASSRDAPAAPQSLDRIRKSQITVLEALQEMHQQFRRERQQRSEQFEQLTSRLEATSQDTQHHDEKLQQGVSIHLEHLSTAMAARIDARVREVLHHLRGELVQWKNQIDRDLQALRDETVNRTELKSRFARLASAAMEDHPAPGDGFLL